MAKAKIVIDFIACIDGDTISFNAGILVPTTFTAKTSGASASNEFLDDADANVLAENFKLAVNATLADHTATNVGSTVTIEADYDDPNLNFGTVTINASDVSLVSQIDAVIFEVAIAITDVVVIDSLTGAIDTTISAGGSLPFTYLWSNGATTQDLANVAAGVYSVTVTDGRSNQVYIAGIEIASTPEILVTAVVKDNDVLVTASGGVSPLTYLWSNGATTKDLTDIEAGNYSLVVTDAETNEKTFNIVVSDFKYFYSQNPISLEIASADPETKANLSFVNEVFVQKDYPAGAYELVAYEEHPADAAGSTVFQSETYLDAFLQAYVPALDLDDLARADGMFLFYNFKFAEKYGSPPVLSDLTQVSANVAIIGGLSDIAFADQASFQSYINSKKPFLNWETSEKKVIPQQPEYLYFIVNDFEQTTIKVFVKLYYADGTNQTITKYTAAGILQRFEVYCFPAGYTQMNLAAVDASKEVIEYEVWVTDQDDTIQSEVKTYILDTDYYPFQRYLLYLSSLGGMATLAVTGKAEKRVKIARETIENNLSHDYSLRSLGQKVTASRGVPEIRFSTGYMIDEEAFKRLEDFIQSEEVYLLDNGKWVPVLCKVDGNSIYDETRMNALNVITGTIYFPQQRRFTPAL